MAFILAPQTGLFWYTVSLPVCNERGTPVVHKFDFQFKRISRSRMTEMQKAQEALSEGEVDIDALERDTDYVMEIAEGWRYVQDEKGDELPFTRENLVRLLDHFPNAAGEILKAFFGATLGGGKKQKN